MGVDFWGLGDRDSLFGLKTVGTGLWGQSVAGFLKTGLGLVNRRMVFVVRESAVW